MNQSHYLPFQCWLDSLATHFNRIGAVALQSFQFCRSKRFLPSNLGIVETHEELYSSAPRPIDLFALLTRAAHVELVSKVVFLNSGRISGWSRPSR